MKHLQFSYQIEDALTSLDGRNRHKLTSLNPFFSERSLNKFRIQVEVEYLKHLSRARILRRLLNSEIKLLDSLHVSFDPKQYKKLRAIESVVNHDMQAVVIYIQGVLKKSSLKDVASMVHFGLTSEDINNIAYALMIGGSVRNVILPELEKLKDELAHMSRQTRALAMLGRTHGQIAAPTTFGKEIGVYVNRLNTELIQLKGNKLKAKLNGNVGNFNAHQFIYPTIDWLRFEQEFITSFGLVPDMITTQIEPYDTYIVLFQTINRINVILSGLCQDLWLYASLGYCKQKAVKQEVGSSALPHKVNPIYLEGAEGGFGIANALFSFYAQKLGYSRLQRDLSDSTVRRSFALPFSYSLLSYQSVREGIRRIAPNEERMSYDLENHYEVLSEAVQNILRSRGHTDAYEIAKSFFRGKSITNLMYLQFVESLTIPKKDIQTLINLTPEKYTGVAKTIKV